MALTMKVFLEPGGKQPQPGRKGDAGFDCFADLSSFKDNICLLVEGSSAKIPLGFHVALYEDDTPTDKYYMEIANRSGFGFNNGVTELSRIVDSSYRGVPHYAIAKITKGSVLMQHGDKVCQLLIHPFVPPSDVKVEVVSSLEELGSTSRGAGGFGSTGS